MILEHERPLGRVRRERTARAVGGKAFKLPVVLDENAIEENADRTGAHELEPVPNRLMENDVVGLPFAGFARRIDHWRILGVDRAGLTVGVVGNAHVGGIGVVRLEHLDLVVRHQKDAGIAAHLRTGGMVFDVGVVPVFKVQLAVAVFAARADEAAVDPARLAVELAFAVAYPLRSLPVGIAPVLLERFAAAVEKDDRVARRPARLGGNLDGIGAVAVMHGPGVLRVGRVAVQTRESRGGSGHRRENQCAFLHHVHPSFI